MDHCCSFPTFTITCPANSTLLWQRLEYLQLHLLQALSKQLWCYLILLASCLSMRSLLQENINLNLSIVSVKRRSSLSQWWHNVALLQTINLRQTLLLSIELVAGLLVFCTYLCCPWSVCLQLGKFCLSVLEIMFIHSHLGMPLLLLSFHTRLQLVQDAFLQQWCAYGYRPSS